MAGDMKALVDKLMGSNPHGAKIAARQDGSPIGSPKGTLPLSLKLETITSVDTVAGVTSIITMTSIERNGGLGSGSSLRPSTLPTGEVQDTPNSPEPTQSPQSNGPSKSGGLPTGAVAGIAVGIALLAILVGAGIFLFLRRRKDQQKHAGDQAEDGTIRKGKQPAGETGSSDVVDSPSTPYPSQETPVPVLPPQPSHTPQQHPPMDQAGPSQIINYRSGSPAIVQPSTTSIHDDGRVSPPLPDGHPDANLHGSSRDLALIATGGGAGSAAEEDPEMQWILEEERRAKERKEHQEELRRPR